MRAPSQDALRAVEELERVADALDELARLEPGLAQSSAADEIVIDSIYVPAGQFYESALLLLRANADPSLQPLTQQVRAELGRMPR